MSEVSRGQALEISSRVGTQVNWDELDGDKLQRIITLSPQEFGKRFTLFLKLGAQVIIGEPKIIQVDRTTSFDPAVFVGAGWTIWKGPANGKGIEGEEEQDKRSLALTELDLTAVRFEDCLRSGENVIKGEERLKRLVAQGDIRLDAGIFFHLWNNQHLIPASWKEKINGNTRYIFFDGTMLRSSSGYRCVLYLYWDDDAWRWSVNWLGRGRSANDPSVVLASSPMASVSMDSSESSEALTLVAAK